MSQNKGRRRSLKRKIKTEDKNFPYEDFEKNGYYSYVYGQKSYNGVAIISKVEISNINKDFIKDDLKQSRIITGEIQLKNKKIEIINIYVPNVVYNNPTTKVPVMAYIHGGGLVSIYQIFMLL